MYDPDGDSGQKSDRGDHAQLTDTPVENHWIHDRWPHSSCKRMPPAKFAALHRQRRIDSSKQQKNEEIS